MKEKPMVGQRVRFNNYGLIQTFGSMSGLSMMKNKVMTITMVGQEMIPDVFDVGVDDPEINQFLIDSLCFDPA